MRGRELLQIWLNGLNGFDKFHIPLKMANIILSIDKYVYLEHNIILESQGMWRNDSRSQPTVNTMVKDYVF